MAIKQLSVFVENKQGNLSDTAKVLADADINIRAMSIADAKDFGILRLIVSDCDKAKELLSEDTIVSINDVIAVKMDDKQGALYKILKVLEDGQINIEYTYAFTAHINLDAYVVFRVDDVDVAEKLLNEKGFATLAQEQVKEM